MWCGFLLPLREQAPATWARLRKVVALSGLHRLAVALNATARYPFAPPRRRDLCETAGQTNCQSRYRRHTVADIGSHNGSERQGTYMAGSKTQAKQRPLSPHLSIWKWGPAMLVSILHRVTGDGMAIVGGIVLTWWLFAVSAGQESYETFRAVATSIPGYIVLVGLSWGFFSAYAVGPAPLCSRCRGWLRTRYQ